MDKEDYIKEQKNCGINIGDEVLIKDSEISGKHGWDNSWDMWMDHTVGCKGKVKSIEDSGIVVVVDQIPWKEFGFIFAPHYGYPFWVLKKIEIDCDKWNCTCYICGCPAYQGFSKFECSMGCL